MKKLLKKYDLQSEHEYFEMINESLINGQRKEAKEQFLAMPRNNRKTYVNFNLRQDCAIEQSDLAMLICLI